MKCGQVKIAGMKLINHQTGHPCFTTPQLSAKCTPAVQTPSKSQARRVGCRRQNSAMFSINAILAKAERYKTRYDAAKQEMPMVEVGIRQ